MSIGDDTDIDTRRNHGTTFEIPHEAAAPVASGPSDSNNSGSSSNEEISHTTKVSTLQFRPRSLPKKP